MQRTAAEKLAAARSMTFDQCAEAYIGAHEPSWKNEKHRQQWRNTLSTYVSPVFGSIPVQDVDTDHIVKVVEPIWSKKKKPPAMIEGSSVEGLITAFRDPDDTCWLDLSTTGAIRVQYSKEGRRERRRLGQRVRHELQRAAHGQTVGGPAEAHTNGLRRCPVRSEGITRDYTNAGRAGVANESRAGPRLRQRQPEVETDRVGAVGPCREDRRD